MPDRPVYLDHHATTPVDPRAFEAMRPFFMERFGNAASLNHTFGEEARAAVEAARSQIAALLACDPRELIFTSGATEANNLAIKGVLQAAPRGSHLVVAATEHPSVLDPADRMARSGCDVTRLTVDEFGRVAPGDVQNAIRDDTALVSVMWANNEVGTINPIDEIAAVCRERGVPFHCDAVQAASTLPVDLTQTDVDLLSLSAHKMYGPKGVGVLFVRRTSPRIHLQPQIDGGGHERHLRSGTLPVPLIVGFGAACEIVAADRDEERTRLQRLRDRLEAGLKDRISGLHVHGHPTQRLANNLNVGIEGVDGDALMTSLTRIAVSSGSACTTADPEPSHVLRAMGVSDRIARAGIRFGLGRFTTGQEIDLAIAHVAEIVDRLRSRSNKIPQRI